MLSPSGRRNIMTTISLINGMVSAGVSIAVLIGVLAMGMGMAAGK
jgi:hypothetical protein